MTFPSTLTTYFSQKTCRVMSALCAGVLTTAALPPIYYTPLLLLSIPLLHWLLDSASSRRDAWWIGWSFGFAFFLTNLYWIGYSLFVDPVAFGWLFPFATAGISAICALYFGLFGVAYCSIVVAPSWRILLFAGLWTLTEWLRGVLLTGFPWNLLGYVWNHSDAMIQPAYYVGVYGLTFVTLLFASLPTMLLRYKQQLFAFITAGLFIMHWAVGMTRLDSYPYPESSGVSMRLVQGNIPQKLHQDSAVHFSIVQEHIRMTQRENSPSLVIWSESSVPFILNQEPELLSWISDQLPQHTTIITGGTRGENDHYPPSIWNSILALQSGSIISHYDKQHLVPFGEYIPLRKTLPLFFQHLITKLTFGSIDFSFGNTPKWMEIDAIPPFSPLMCYEVIFPHHVKEKDTHPEWMLNLTNDAWFGDSPGPYQHFEMARMRAVEEGIPLVRVANSGITAVIDPLGRVVAKAPLEKKAVLDVILPKPIGRMESRLWKR